MEVLIICSFAHKGLAKYMPLSKPDLLIAQDRYLQSVEKKKTSTGVKTGSRLNRKILHFGVLPKTDIQAKGSKLMGIQHYLQSTMAITSRLVGRKNELAILDHQNKQLITYDHKTREILQDTRFSPWISKLSCSRVWKRSEGYLYISVGKTINKQEDSHFGVFPHGKQQPIKTPLFFTKGPKMQEKDVIVQHRNMINVFFTKTGSLAVLVAQDNPKIPPQIHLVDLKTGNTRPLLDLTKHVYESDKSVFTLFEDTIFVMLGPKSKILKFTGLSCDPEVKFTIKESPNMIGVNNAIINGLESCEHGLILYKRVNENQKSSFTLIDLNTLMQQQVINFNDNGYNGISAPNRSLVFKTKLNLSVVLFWSDIWTAYVVAVRPGAAHLIVSGRSFRIFNVSLAIAGFVLISPPDRKKPSPATKGKAAVHTLLGLDLESDKNLVIRLRLP